MNPTLQSEEFIGAKELANLLKCGKSTIYALVRKRQIPFIGIGDTGVRFDREAVLTALTQPRPQRAARKRKPRSNEASQPAISV